ncbi:L-histidine N(alpha)-methyltransferase [Methyloceanibacter sp. wino2]|uniref:L-histidine N(alpha)-methyltransferase n=1 Tax=Methyloceanibacter sp. wino2 TaxID=2170729 RepID=UPI000D3E1737|nr:L-histidine N(alpha)-methyltransferase [Methyloceanibacter sp. wino2]
MSSAFSLSQARDGNVAEADEPTRAVRDAEFATAVLEGLAQKPRHIPSRFLYDEAGSALFEEITKLDEYYPTRTEIALLRAYGDEIAECVGPVETLVEFGSGSSRKTRLLIEALDGLETYVPIDVSESFLAEAAEGLEADFEDLTVRPVVGDFTKPRDLHGIEADEPLGFFSGSTIGNLTHEEATDFLENATRLLGPGSTFLIGVDLQKNLDILIPAYDDARGVTASFSLNLLARINRELDGDFDADRFAHRAVYNPRQGRIEIYLESLADQTVHVLGQRFDFTKGERIHTENSHKYSIEGFQDLARRGGWEPAEVWTDEAALFSLHLLRAA